MIAIQTGTITGFSTGKYLNLEKQQIVQLTIENDNDAINALYINVSGQESPPQNGDRVTVLKIGNFSLALGGFDSIEPSTDQGEKLIYSRDANGNVAGSMYLKKDGSIEVNGNADYAVSYNDLASAINNLVTSINTAIAGAITGHVHATVTSLGTPSPGTGTAPSVTADISGAKVESVKLP